MGDLNYRINGQISSVLSAISQNRYDLLEYCDQLKIEASLGRVMWGFEEGKIEFAPTYKIQSNSNYYERSRIPGWTDRIIYSSKHNIIK